MSQTEVIRQNLSEEAAKNVLEWLEKPKYKEYNEELQELIDAGEWQKLEDGFFKVVEFGTGGRRGMTGVGSNRINKVTIGESAQALCEYAKSFDETAPEKGIVIACDTRLSSPELSKYAAQVCAAAGFKTYLFDGFRATPELSFAVRYLNAAAGIVISASHNPPADNGFKAYWNDGAQLVAPHDKEVVKKGGEIEEIFAADYDEAVTGGQIELIGTEIDTAYVAAVVEQAEGKERDVNIVYSPLHGAGQTNVLPVLKEAGFTNVSVVESQMVPDGNFPTIENGKPNPEEKAANDRAVAQMLAEDADIAITNDPDADRIGVIVRHNEDPVYLSGNQSAVLAIEYALRKLQENSALTSNHYIAKTIVTTDMLNAIANKYGAKTYDNMLIGFKYIGELIHKKESTNEIFVAGAEESYGLLKGDYARDKDGAAGALPLAEYAAELKRDGKTLYDRLLELFKEYGIFVERQDNLMYPGASGFEQMRRIMAKLRSDPPKEIDGQEVTAILDYKTLEKRNLLTGEVSSIDCINGDVVVLEFGDKRRRTTIRPSGTEPKLKIYSQWYKDVKNDPEHEHIELSNQLEALGRELEGILLEP